MHLLKEEEELGKLHKLYVIFLLTLFLKTCLILYICTSYAFEVN